MPTEFKLNTGAVIPALGLGTWQDADSQEDAVYHALKAGYHHIDTARISRRGQGHQEVRSPPRENFPHHQAFNAHHPDDVEKAVDASLKDLDTDYVDLFLIHWPVAFARGDELFPKDGNKPKMADIDYIDTYKALEKVFKKGKVKAIGISNFSKAEVERILKECEGVPAVHQMEMHPWLQQKEFADFHRQKGIHITHYSSLGNQNEIYGDNVGKVIEDPVLQEIGKKHDKTSAQFALAWGIARGHSVIPKSKTTERIPQNFRGGFKLDEDDLKKIDGIDKKLRFNDYSESFGYNFFTDLDGKQ
ncbi:aldehyde reductase [Diaporthe eres]|uniref:NADP-dependent oxidoreductase domain-containing protein n=1 Tax=Diaporthe vaccinii TaxID=105482 RepID=A0ABR4EIT1_9PEZI|nr:aldehyde reductase [Diaporthe eres]